jgi:hypothetical protein
VAAAVLATTGGLRALRRLRLRWWLIANPRLRARDRHLRAEQPEFARRYGSVLGPVGSRSTRSRRALIVSCRRPALEAELAVVKAVELAGFEPVMLLDDTWRRLRGYYTLTGASVRLTSEFTSGSPRPDGEAAAVIARCDSVGDLAAYTSGHVRVGRIAASTALRRGRVGSLDIRSRDDAQALRTRLADSVMAAAQAERALDAVAPDLVMFIDTEYTPWGELFDAALHRGTDIVAYDLAHRTSAYMFKRYGRWNSDRHPTSLSDETWTALLDGGWNTERGRQVRDELERAYASGDWYGARRTQTGRQPADAYRIREELGLDPSKPTVVVFAHIAWDAPLWWGRPLFTTFDDWLVAVARAACANDRVNWVFKIHPANIAKQVKEGYAGEPAELRALRRAVPALPRHMAIVPPDWHVTTSSLLDITDVCLTVRGTAGIEAARRGIPVLTASASRYSGKGFTIDSDTREEFYERLARVHDVPRYSTDQMERAERYAYGLFVQRPLLMRSVTWGYGRIGEPAHARINIASPDEWRVAPDVAPLAAWLGGSRDEDFLGGDAS